VVLNGLMLFWGVFNFYSYSDSIPAVIKNKVDSIFPEYAVIRLISFDALPNFSLAIIKKPLIMRYDYEIYDIRIDWRCYHLSFNNIKILIIDSLEIMGVIEGSLSSSNFKREFNKIVEKIGLEIEEGCEALAIGFAFSYISLLVINPKIEDPMVPWCFSGNLMNYERFSEEIDMEYSVYEECFNRWLPLKLLSLNSWEVWKRKIWKNLPQKLDVPFYEIQKRKDRWTVKIRFIGHTEKGGVKYIIEEWEIEIMDNGVVKKVRSRLLFKNILKGCLFYLSE